MNRIVRCGFSSVKIERELKAMVHQLWPTKFMHDGILWVTNDSGKIVLAPSAAKAFCALATRQIQTGSYLPEDVQAIQNYCLEDFHHEHFFPIANNHLGVVVSCQSTKSQHNLSIVTLDQPVLGGRTSNSQQETCHGQDHPEVSNSFLRQCQQDRESLAKILVEVEKIRNHLLGPESEHGLCSKYTKIDLCDSSSAEQRIHQRTKSNEIRDGQTDVN